MRELRPKKLPCSYHFNRKMMINPWNWGYPCFIKKRLKFVANQGWLSVNCGAMLPWEWIKKPTTLCIDQSLSKMSNEHHGKGTTCDNIVSRRHSEIVGDRPQLSILDGSIHIYIYVNMYICIFICVCILHILICVCINVS